MKQFLVFLIALAMTACHGHGPASSPSPGTNAAADLTAKTVALVEVDEEDDTARAFCSGVWVSESEIMTAAHCVRVDPLAALFGQGLELRYATKADVFESGGTVEKRYPLTRRANVERIDDDHDIALLKVSGPVPAHGVAVIASGEILQGAFVQAMGHSKGLWWSYSSGDVAAIRDMPLGTDPMLWIQTTTPISPGNSGGGLFDGEGNLIGICSRSIASPRAQNLNFFVHRDYLAALLKGAS